MMLYDDDENDAKAFFKKTDFRLKTRLLVIDQPNSKVLYTIL